MKRFGAHFIYCSPCRVVPKGVIEVDDEGLVLRIFSLNEFPQEIHSTIFYNGILVPNLFLAVQVSIFSGQAVFSVLDDLYKSSGSHSFSEGQVAHIYLLDGLDLQGRKFLPESGLSIIL